MLANANRTLTVQITQKKLETIRTSQGNDARIRREQNFKGMTPRE